MRRMPYFGENCEVDGRIDDVDSNLCKCVENTDARVGSILASYGFRLKKVRFETIDDDYGYKSYAEGNYERILDAGIIVRLVIGYHKSQFSLGEVNEAQIRACRSDENGQFIDPPDWYNNGSCLITGTRKSVGLYLQKPEEIQKLLDGMRGLGIDRQTWGISESGGLAMNASTASRYCCALLIPGALQAMQLSGCLEGYKQDEYTRQIDQREFELSTMQSDNQHSQNHSIRDQQPNENVPVDLNWNYVSQWNNSAKDADGDLDSLAREWGYGNWDHFEDSLPD